MTEKIKRILQTTAWYMLCFVFLLTMKTPFGVRINYDKGFLSISIVFACAATIFLISSSICVFANLLKEDGSTKGFFRDNAIMWAFNAVMFTLLEGLIFGEVYYLSSIPTTLYICSINLGFQTLCYWIRNLYRERNELLAINEMLKQQQELHYIKNDDDSASEKEKQCVLHSDYNGQEITINPNNFIYVESVGNYANVCYIDEENLTNTTIRTTIKRLKEELSSNEFIVQCHRGFLVNLNYVESMEGANGRFYLNMFYSDKKIPVSRANKSIIKDSLSALQHKCCHVQAENHG